MKKNIIYSTMDVKKDGVLAYHIYFEQSFDALPEKLSQLNTQNRNVCIVTDSNVAPLYAQKVAETISSVCKRVVVYTFPAGEQHKNLDTVTNLYRFLIEEKFDRKDLLIALGGGVTGDLTGFAAATYLRGIDFVQVPTTLLAQVDSSIGGKTGVDFDCYKNMVGAFHQPKMVYINIATLNTLSDEQFYCGMGEVLKHGLIKDASYYEWTIEHMSEICERDQATLLEMVSKSCNIKRLVVEKDPLEKGERALLNFGHTLGHSIEKLMNFQWLHGQCIALGYVMASQISWKRGLLTDEEFFEIRDMNVGFELPISFSGLNPQEILAATKVDKKMENGTLKFILLDGIGNAVIDRTVTDQEILDAINYFNADLEIEESK
ncbi:MAG: 3-dehydroquinate synthase [Lachnospiraceae bacterium]|nr:3-dehydroquinate synthase [Robinsoniella sp.]MDY3765381.1 3-dehydroquinate synthase [Lachnospiraceae bacterium]